MKLIRHLDELPDRQRGGAVSIGNFDGVHRGHARIIERLVAHAREAGGPATVFTFDPHPVRLLRPEAAPPPLTWTDRKAELLAELGVDAMIAYPTDEALLAMEPEEFFDRIVRRRLAARAMVEGPNFFFGRGRTGTVDLLDRLCRDESIALEVVRPVEADGEPISSSRIRRLVAGGNVQQAGRLLTRPYRIRGMVTHGVGRGAKIGYATANVEAVDTLLPRVGVYAGRAHVDGESRPAAVSIGPNPTFGEKVLKVEAHLIDFDGSLYGRPIEIELLARLRDVRPFGSVEMLTRQLARDIEQVQNIASDPSCLSTGPNL